MLEETKPELDFVPQHKRLLKETIKKMRTKKTHIVIEGDTRYHLQHIGARMGISRRLTYNDIIKLLILVFYKGRVNYAMDSPEAKAILEGSE